MDRINSAGTVLNASGHRIRVQKNLSTGTNGTELDYNYDNDLQESLIAGIIEEAGETPTAGDIAQLFRCIAKLLPSGGIYTRTSGSLTIPANVYEYKVRVRGGGGGSGGTLNSNSSSSGAGGSPRRTAVYPCAPGDVLSWLIGSGGAAGNASPSDGGFGGTSTFYQNGNPLIVVTGGSGSAAANASTGTGIGSSGTSTVSGSPIWTKEEAAISGGSGYSIGGTQVEGGWGGGAGGGSISGRSNGSTSTVGQSPTGPGGGAGGSIWGAAGVAGAAGDIEITWGTGS